MDIEKKLKSVLKRLEESHPEAHTERYMLASEAIELSRILEFREGFKEDIFDFFLKIGLITVEEKDKFKLEWNDFKIGDLKK